MKQRHGGPRTPESRAWLSVFISAIGLGTACTDSSPTPLRTATPEPIAAATFPKPYPEGCDARQILLTVAGPLARDCGTRDFDDDVTAQQACMVAALTSGLPFYALTEGYGIDSFVASGYASAGVGMAVELHYDSYMGGAPIQMSGPAAAVTPDATERAMSHQAFVLEGDPTPRAVCP